MQASVVVKRIPYVTEPSPANRTSLFRSVTSCRKLCGEDGKLICITLAVCQTYFCRWRRMYREPKFSPQNPPTTLSCPWSPPRRRWCSCTRSPRGSPSSVNRHWRLTAHLSSTDWDTSWLCNPKTWFKLSTSVSALKKQSHHIDFWYWIETSWNCIAIESCRVSDCAIVRL